MRAFGWDSKVTLGIDVDSRGTRMVMDGGGAEDDMRARSPFPPGISTCCNGCALRAAKRLQTLLFGLASNLVLLPHLLTLIVKQLKHS